MKFDIRSNAKKLGAFMAMGAVFTGLSLMTAHGPAKASDHDDGETGVKARNLNLTDLYVFRQDWETGVAADASKLVLIMDTNPRSLPRQQYFFNDNANYNFHIGRQSSINNAVTGNEDLRFQFSFGAPNTNGVQQFTLTEYTFSNNTVQTSAVVGTGNTTAAAPLLGASPAPAPVSNTVGNATIFAGLREDPFFFDVEQFFKVRAALASSNGPTPAAGSLAGGFRTPDQAQDFAVGYNVNAIVMSIPIANLQSAANETAFDVWETITLPPSSTVTNLLNP
jgi:hypothetical protein